MPGLHKSVDPNDPNLSAKDLEIIRWINVDRKKIEIKLIIQKFKQVEQSSDNRCVLAI